MNTRLYRSPDDRVLAGVAGGMAESYGLDPALVRVGWALLILFTGGVFLVVYVIMALVVPLRPYGNAAHGEGSMPGGSDAPPPGARLATSPQRDASGTLVIGVILVLVGAFFLFRQFIPALDFGLIWPVVVIVAGVVLLLASFGRSSGRPS